jgi:hypothetical protein
MDMAGRELSEEMLKHGDWVEIMKRDQGNPSPKRFKIDDGHQCKDVTVYTKMNKDQLIGLCEMILEHHIIEDEIELQGRGWTGQIHEDMTLHVRRPHKVEVSWGKCKTIAFVSPRQPKTDLENQIYNEWKLCAGRYEYSINGQKSENFNPDNWPEVTKVEIKLKTQLIYWDGMGGNLEKCAMVIYKAGPIQGGIVESRQIAELSRRRRIQSSSQAERRIGRTHIT